MTQGFSEVKLGDTIMVVVHRDEWARLFSGEVICEEPLRLKVYVDDATAVHDGDHAMLLVGDTNSPSKGRGTINRAFEEGDHFVLSFLDVEWSLADRRRTQRFHVRVPIELSAVIEEPEGPKITVVQGTSKDISMGGAWVDMDNPVAKGTLVEFKTWIGAGKMVRTLAIVVHSSAEQGGVGVEFVNFLADSEAILEDFLAQQAA